MAFSIQIKGLGKHFGEFTALRNLSASIQEGDRVSVLGHNGAGKSTLLNLIATLSRPTSGDIHYIQDNTPLTDRKEIRAKLTYLAHEPMLYPDLTAAENLIFAARLHGRELDQHALDELLVSVGMDHAKNRLFRDCSRGMQQRLSLARAMLPKPNFLLLDEPFSGLDTEGVARIRTALTANSLSWLLVTHDLHLGYELANRFWILKKGRLVEDLRKTDLDYDRYISLARVGGGAAS